MAGTDTEVLLAQVVSLLAIPTPDATVLLDALVEHDGNPERTARFLNKNGESSTQSHSPTRNKRKRKLDLTDWFKQPTSKGALKEPVLEKVAVSAEPDTVASAAKSSKPSVDLMSILRQAPSAPQKSPPRLPPLLLSTPEMITQHVPCTLHTSVLPAELACTLFHTMLKESQSWQRNKWWLFDRMVESPHRTAFFTRKSSEDAGTDDAERARHWYNGRMSDIPKVFPAPMEQACDIVERIVNEELRKRTRFPLEYAGHRGEDLVWRANFAASNCYEGGKESVGWHSDQMTYLGPYCTIASLSLGTRRIFSLREVVPTQERDLRVTRTFNIPLPHNSLTIMHASCQERFKHSIPPQSIIDVYRPSHPPGAQSSNCRINITFRFFRPDFPPSSIPKCKCGEPMILRPDMKNRSDGESDRYWWTCYSGAQNEGKGCGLWQVMDMKAEGRGPVVGDLRCESPS